MKKVGVAVIVLLVCLLVGGAYAGINDGLVAYYPFSGTANDASGNGNNGTVIGATLTTDRFGNVNSAYSFDGVNDYISVPHSSSIDFGDEDMSISIWFKTSDTFQNYLMGKNYDPAGKFWGITAFGVYPGGDTTLTKGIAMVIHDGSVTSQALPTSNYDVTNGLWHHAVFVRDTSANEMRLYIDGAYISTQPDNSGSLNNISNMLIGRLGIVWNIDPRFFNGLIDDIRMYKRTLSASEIQQLYTGSTCSQTDYDAAYQQGYQAAMQAMTNNGTTQCAYYDFFTATVHVPCFSYSGINYWLDFGLQSANPLLFNLNFGTK